MNIAYFIVAKSIGGIETYLKNIKDADSAFYISHTAKSYYETNISKNLFFIEFTSLKGIVDLIKNRTSIVSLDIIHANDLITFFYAYIVLRFLNKRLKIIVTIHSVFSEHRIFMPTVQKLLIHIFSKLAMHSSVKIIAVSKYCKKDLIKLGISEKKINVVYHGVVFPENVKGVCQPKNYAFVGRLSFEKGIDVFLGMVDKISTFQPLVIGRPAIWNDLEDYKHNYPNVMFLGQIDNLDDIYKKTDVVCITSRTESFCFVLLEALSRQKIVYSVSLPIVNELLESTPKLRALVVCSDSNIMAEKITEVDVDAWNDAYDTEYRILKEKYSLKECVYKTRCLYDK